MCNGVEWSRQAAESVKKGDHSRRTITGRRGPQGKHALATIKSALWTTEWLTFTFPWPTQVSFSQQ